MSRTLIKECVKKMKEQVELMGWVEGIRLHGKLIFADLRDRSGLIQLVFHKDISVAALKVAKGLKAEEVVAIEGRVKARERQFVNEKIETGKIEVEVSKLTILSEAKALPFDIHGSGYDIKEELRLKYRYLDLRRPRMNYNLRLRSAVVQFIREFLLRRDFVEVETPILTKSTPEGARDFLVPSRLQPGKFYALPQSPQQYKQLLMVAGLERYFQIARCFRDEDPRADRAYGEFTQLDLEMSFVTQEDILSLIEELFTSLVEKIFPGKRIGQSPWPKIAHHEAVKKYGNDKPDLRKNKKEVNELAFAWIIDFPLFTKQTKEDFFHGSGRAKFAPSHHMFTAPHPDDIAFLDSDPMKVRGLQHDLVLNGYEVGGGSIRIHDAKIQQKIFDLIGFSVAQKQEFHHMLEAFSYGVPPHGGIAPGIDRFLMAALGEPSIREVMAYPAISSGKTAVMEAPSAVTKEQLSELDIEVKDQGEIPVLERITNLFSRQKIAYHLYKHAPVKTSEEAAKVRGTKLAQGAKALILIADKKPIMTVLAGNCKIDFKKFKQAKRIKDLRMATAEEVAKVTGVEIGAVPPLGNLFHIPVYFDELMTRQKEVVFNAGAHDKSISMKYEDLNKTVNPEVFAFAKEI